MNNKEIAVLIPCYNESVTIRKVIRDFKQVLPNATIYVYDNNSSDNTDIIAKEEGAVVKYEFKQGKGNVIRSMFRDIQADAYIMIDGDDTYPAEYAPEMIRLVLDNNVDMVVGDRLSSTYFQENKRPFHNIGNKTVRKLINILFKSDIQDIMTGYRAFSYNFIKTYPVTSDGFEIETEMTIHALDKKMNVDNVIIEYRDRPEGSVSKLNTYVDGFKVIKTIGKLFKNYKPFIFFTILSIVLSIIGLSFFTPILIDYFQTGLVAKIPTLIVSSFVILAGLLAFFAGLILDVINHNQRAEFQIKINEITIQKDFIKQFDVGEKK